MKHSISFRAGLLSVTFLGALTACGAAGGDDQTQLTAAEPPLSGVQLPSVQLQIAGEAAAVQVLPGSSWAAPEERDYALRVQGRTLELSASSTDDGASYLELSEAEALLAALELRPEALALRAPDGRWLHSNTGELPAELAEELVGALPLALLSGDNLERIDAAVRGDAPGDTQIGVARQALRPRVGVGEGCGTTCKSDDGAQSCCCKVGDRCVTTLHTCKCELAAVVGAAAAASAAAEVLSAEPAAAATF
jgi:hypothetical protein